MNATEGGDSAIIPSHLRDAALALSEPQRAALAVDLILSLETSDDASGPEWPDGWQEELERRATAVDRGETTFSQQEIDSEVREVLMAARAARSVPANPRP